MSCKEITSEVTEIEIRKSAINNGNEKEKGTSSEIPSDGEPLKVQASGHKAVQGNLGNQIPGKLFLVYKNFMHIVSLIFFLELVKKTPLVFK